MDSAKLASQTLHLTGERRLPEGRRVYAVGDIHGRADLLHKLQGQILADIVARPSPEATVVWLGDYVDRGSDTRQVISMLVDFAHDGCRSIFLMGNHEIEMLRFLAKPLDGAHWLNLGGGATLASYGVELSGTTGEDLIKTRLTMLAALPPPHKDFFLSLLTSVRIGDFFFCHAGVRPGVSLEAQDPEDLMWIREEFLHADEDFGAVVVHGHTPVRRPEVLANRINVDTGAFATGKLTCAVIEGNEVGFLSTAP